MTHHEAATDDRERQREPEAAVQIGRRRFVQRMTAADDPLTLTIDGPGGALLHRPWTSDGRGRHRCARCARTPARRCGSSSWEDLVAEDPDRLAVLLVPEAGHDCPRRDPLGAVGDPHASNASRQNPRRASHRVLRCPFTPARGDQAHRPDDVGGEPRESPNVRIEVLPDVLRADPRTRSHPLDRAMSEAPRKGYFSRPASMAARTRRPRHAGSASSICASTTATPATST